MSDNVLPVEDSRSPVHKGLLTGSLFYLLSAASILIGLTKILVPIFDADGQVQEKLWSVGVINLYEVGLLAVLLVVMWRKVYDDAVSLTMLVAVFLVASTVTLNVVAAQLPWIVLGLGVAGLGLCIGKLTLICRCVTGRLPMMSLLGVMILMVGNLAMPGIMGYIQSHQGTNGQLHELWFMGWWWTMVGVLVLTIAMMTGMIEPFCGEVSRPIIHSKPFRMGFVMLIVIATIGQQWAMQWAFFLKGGLPDLLLAWPVLAVMGLAYMGWSKRTLDPIQVIGLFVPGVIVILIQLIWDVGSPIKSPWFLLAQPSAVLIISVMLVLVLARRSPWWLLISIACSYGMFIAMFWPGRVDGIGLSPRQMSWTVTGIMFAIAIGSRHYAAMLGFAASLGVSLLTVPFVLPWWDSGTEHSWMCLILVPAVLCSVTLCFYRQIVPLRLTVALLLLGQMIVLFMVDSADTHTAEIGWLVFALGWAITLAGVHRQVLLVIPGLAPMLLLGYMYTQHSPGWQMVAVSFLLLVSGLGVSWHRSRTAN
ncbi:MAG TPA: hypothetical protein DER01_14670 [Phycisphaerales bacterium]|nr:hypothetical protein [Phycisphaerales bacterium]